MSGRQPILDEFTALPVSRQRKWQLRRRKEGVMVSMAKAKKAAKKVTKKK